MFRISERKGKLIYILMISLIPNLIWAQFVPKNLSPQQIEKAHEWVDSTYQTLSQDERLGQLFIVSLYTNKGQAYIDQVRQTVKNEKIGGVILMQDDAATEINLVNEFQTTSKIPLFIGMDAEWGLNQRIAGAYKFPWAMTLGAIQNNHLIYDMATKIAHDAKRMGVNWVFAPDVDVNTNPDNPIIGNRSFGSNVRNVTRKGLAYVRGLQDHDVLSSIKHFPGHGDTSVDSHLDLPVVNHDLERLKDVELAPFRNLTKDGVAAVMVAHLYVPALEPNENVPSSVSPEIITGLLKDKFGFKGLIVTDALNMGAVAKRYKPGVLDAMAFAAGDDVLLFSQAVSEGKRLIQQAIDQGTIPESRVEESVKKILLAKYYLGLFKFKPINADDIQNDLNNYSHVFLAEQLYANALTLLKNQDHLLPLKPNETVYYVPLEEAPYQDFSNALSRNVNLIITPASEIGKIPEDAKVIIGFHKDNSTAYKPYKISQASKDVLSQLTSNHHVILDVFGSPYALKDIDISKVNSVLVSYENNRESMNATARAMMGETKIHGRLPVTVNEHLKYGAGKDLDAVEE